MPNSDSANAGRDTFFKELRSFWQIEICQPIKGLRPFWQIGICQPIIGLRLIGKTEFANPVRIFVRRPDANTIIAMNS
ncbi:MAG TPA: hypothetical protein PLL35_02640 [Candidatus Cloacimonas sp.]|nr:hypothetical protein [Candidatus Cloacimonas sp.]HQO18282.1 hypothetical protein [Candidatus Cloacimonas sp.]